MREHNVFIVDDNRSYLAACGRLVRRRGFSPILLSTYEDARHSFENLGSPPEAVLIDVVLNSGHSGLELRRQLESCFPNKLAVALMSAYQGPDGCNAVRKSDFAKIEEFLSDAVVLHVTAFHPVVSTPLLAFVRRHRLSPQNARIVAHLFTGSTRTSLASDMGLSENTVKSQVRDLLRHIDVDSADHLTALLLRFSFDLMLNKC
jgi:FixJ family two-component response regulator